MRAIWKGGISFGLVYIPIRLYSASTQHRIELDMVREGDMCPIKYMRVCQSDGKEVAWEDIVKGYEYRKGDYVILSDEDFERANPKKTKTIDIFEFVSEKDVGGKYLEKPYFIEPAPEAAKTYALLRDALKKSGKVGLAKYVLRSSEHLGILKVEGDLIMLLQIRFQNDLREPDGLKLPDDVKPSKKELDMALLMIEQMSAPFEPEKYKDTYKEELMKIIQEKMGKKPKKKAKKEEEPETTEADRLLEQLKASLEAMQEA